MLVWVIFAVLTAAVVWALTRPLTAPTAEAESEPAGLEVYKAQLREIEADRGRGLIGEAEADAARVEVSRRLLAEADRADQKRPAGAPVGSRAVLTAIAAGLPLAAAAIYLLVGSPSLPSEPHAARLAQRPEQAPLADLVARVEARLREHPEDGRGWDVIAPVYLRQERYGDAVNAYARALRLLGETPKRLAGFAEASVLASNGVVTEEARAAYEKIVRLDPARPEPRFWLALAKEQDGELAKAAEDYEALLASAPAAAPWRAAVEERLRIVTARLAGGDKAGPRGPTAADVAAASKLSAEDQSRMIAQMVDGLAQRLKANGRDVEGWQRLLRAYTVLGDKAKASAALADARKALAGDAKALGAIEAVAAELGIGS
jgi:cytochrome c-type biogenesis protein CcmH